MVSESENEGTMLKIKEISLENDFKFIKKHLAEKSFDLLTQFL